MIYLKESSPKIGILMLLLICLSVLILKGACQTGVKCPTNYQCKACPNDTYGCTECLSGQGLSMELYPSPNYVCRDCGAFCTNCLNRTNCTECSPGYGPLGSTNCSACVIPNCLTCPDKIETCGQCKPGYAFYSGSNACGACSQHCEFGCDKRFPDNCDKCDPGYGYIGTTFACGACSPHCTFGCNGTGAGKCDQCDAGYGTVSDGSCAPITTTPIITTTTTPTTTTITTTTITAAPTSGQASSQTTGQTSSQTTGQTSRQTTGQTSRQITGQTSSQITGQNSSQITGQTDATLNPITGATGTTGYPNGGSTKAPDDRFNSNTAIMATLLSLILGGIVISIFVIGCWASRFSQAAAASTQAAAIKTTILQEPILQEPVRRMVTVPENYRLLRN